MTKKRGFLKFLKSKRSASPYRDSWLKRRLQNRGHGRVGVGGGGEGGKVDPLHPNWQVLQVINSSDNILMNRNRKSAQGALDFFWRKRGGGYLLPPVIKIGEAATVRILALLSGWKFTALRSILMNPPLQPYVHILRNLAPYCSCPFCVHPMPTELPCYLPTSLPQKTHTSEPFLKPC